MIDVLQWDAIAVAVHPLRQHRAPLPSPFPYLPLTPQELLTAYLEIVGVSPADAYSAQVTHHQPFDLMGRTSAKWGVRRTGGGPDLPCADGKPRKRMAGGHHLVIAYRDAPAYVEGRARFDAYAEGELKAHLRRGLNLRVAVPEAAEPADEDDRPRRRRRGVPQRRDGARGRLRPAPVLLATAMSETPTYWRREMAGVAHEAVIAGGGPAGMMLAAESALAKVDVGGRRAAPRSRARRRTGGRDPLAHDRGARSARRRRPVPRGRAGGSGRDVRHDRDGHERLPVAASVHARRSSRASSSGSWPPGSPSCRCRSCYGHEVTGFAQDDDGVDVRLSDGESLRGAVPRRVRRRTQPDPQGGRHRVPGLGRDAGAT